MVTPPVAEPELLASAKIGIGADGTPFVYQVDLPDDAYITATVILYLQHGAFTTPILDVVNDLDAHRRDAVRDAVVEMQAQALMLHKTNDHAKAVEELSTPLVDPLVIGSNYVKSPSSKNKS